MKKENARFFWIVVAAILLLPPALLINLGLPTFIDDEGIRSLVALEMKLSGNHIVPTLNGELYYKKPPLYNWLILSFFNGTGIINEVTARLPTLFCLLGYALTVYYFFRKHYDTKIAFLNGFLLITCGRILFWDSLLGLIDIGFSWVMFVLFMSVYHEFQRGRLWHLFLLSYSLTAVGFMMKGLPAIVFQGFTLVSFFVYQKQFKQLFTFKHIVGGLLFLLIIGIYYFIYNQYNTLSSVFPTLLSESSKRTAAVFGIWKTILHLFTFPFEMVYHFLPWSILVIYFFTKNAWQEIRKDTFIAFNVLLFFANIIVYWFSVEVYPRYLLMLTPLIFSAFLHLHFKNEQDNALTFRFLDRFFLIILALIALGNFAPIFLERTQATPNLYLKTFSIGIALSIITILYYKWKPERLLLIVLFLLVLRISFNWFVLPDRNANDFGDLCRDTTIEMGRKFKKEKMYVYKETGMQYTNSFYLTNERQQIVPHRRENFEADALYIIDPQLYPDVQYEKVGEFKVRHGKMTYDIVRLKL